MPIQSDMFVDALRREIGAKAFEQLKVIRDAYDLPHLRYALKFAIDNSAPIILRGKESGRKLVLKPVVDSKGVRYYEAPFHDWPNRG